MNTNTLTVDYLNMHKACKGGVEFAIRNKLIGYPLNKLDSITGDYGGFVSWIREEAYASKRDNDTEKHDTIQETHPSGNKYAWERTYHGNGQLFQIIRDSCVILEIPKF